MKQGWGVKQWSEIVEIRSGKNQKSVENNEGRYPILGSAGKVMGYATDYICEEETTIIGRKGTINTPLFINTKFWNVDTAFGLHALEGLNKRYLYYFCLSFDFSELDKGSGRPSLVKSDLLKIRIPIPPLPEQKQIVAILDKAFAAIDKAQANLEKNIANAEELFQSKLNEVFSQKGEGWEEKALGDIAYIKSGGTPSRSTPEYWECGDIPWYSSGELNETYTQVPDRYITKLGLDNSNAKLFPKGSLLIGMYDTAALKMSIIDRDATFNQAISGIEPNAKINLNFIMLAINANKPELLKQRRGVRQKNLSLTKIKEIKVPLPNIQKQQKVVRTLEELLDTVDKIKNYYLYQQNSLTELKKALLQKAFAGELTKEIAEIIPFPRKVDGISETDLQCGFIAMSYKKHEELGKLKHFHHVKAEKIIHLIESHVGIELGRTPLQDVAGPNDYIRVKRKVEPRAKKAGFFSVTKVGTRHDYLLGTKAPDLIAKVQNALTAEQQQQVNHVLDLLAPMKTQQAEIVATLYAAWNNLLLENKHISDEAIVYAARENWHDSKLEIERQRFFNALNWMREEDIHLIPHGKGKLVQAKIDK